MSIGGNSGVSGVWTGTGFSSYPPTNANNEERDHAQEALPWLVQNLWSAYTQDDRDRMFECISMLFQIASDITGREVSAKPGDPQLKPSSGLLNKDDPGGSTRCVYVEIGRSDNPWKVGDRVRVRKGLLSLYRGALPFGRRMVELEGLPGVVTWTYGNLTWVSISPEKPVFPWHHSALSQNTDTPTRWGDIVNDLCPTPHEPHRMHDAICTNCNKQCKIPFKSDGVRPVYCRMCYRKRMRTHRAPSAYSPIGKPMPKMGYDDNTGVELFDATGDNTGVVETLSKLFDATGDPIPADAVRPTRRR